ncbi:MAG: hypothetical protein KC620_19640 [Myxococcales bacterium]|nr:hypothetical protein [Myxococcales bacterium]
MRIFGLAACFALLLAAGCGGSNPALSTQHLSYQGRERTYHVYLPPGHSKATAAPLVIALHGGGGSGAGFDDMTRRQFTTEAEKRGLVVVFPEGVEKGWNDGRPLQSARDKRRANVDDVGFLTHLIDKLHADLGIDRQRVYFTGISNGGFMTQRYAIDRGDRVAAAAAVTANLAAVWADRTPRRPVPILYMNGTGDPLVPYDGGQVKVFGQARGAILSTADSIAWWAGHDHCVGNPQISKVPDIDPKDGTFTVIERHGPCAEGSEVVLYKVEGGGHSWPGGNQYLPQAMIGKVSQDFRAVDALFDFFARHRLPSPPPE